MKILSPKYTGNASMAIWGRVDRIKTQDRERGEDLERLVNALAKLEEAVLASIKEAGG